MFPCPHCCDGIWVDVQRYIDKKIVNHIIKCTEPTEDDLTDHTDTDPEDPPMDAHTDADGN